MSALLFKVLHLYIWFLALIVSGLILYFFQKNEVEILEHLDTNHWSIRHRKNPKIKTVTMRKILNHYFYVVIYFEEKEYQSMVIWKDQISIENWKRLLMRAKLN